MKNLVKTDFDLLYENLASLYEHYNDGHLELAKPIDLHNCRNITSDVVDIRGELEKSACLVYNDTLTRVAARVLIFRKGEHGNEVLMRFWRSAVYLPGGGFDLEKDNYNIENTVRRETVEELNINIDNIRPTSQNFWRYDDKPWVHNHVTEDSDRWYGYYSYVYTADYIGTGLNDLPEEEGRYRWYAVEEVLKRPDTKELKCYKDAIIENGYAASLTEEVELTEGKELPPVSYFVHDMADQPAIAGLAKILSSNFIIASYDNDDNSRYVSTSRDLMSHAGPTWKCGLVLDAAKISDRYKINPINKNSMIYLGLTPTTNKQLQLRAISKYVADDDESLVFYCIDLNGSRFFTEISEQTYEIFKDIMLAFNAKLAVQTQEPGKGGSDKYKGRTMGDVKKYSDQHPVRYDRSIQKDKLPNNRRDHTWHCVESCGYNVQNSSLVLKLSELSDYKDLILERHGVDITATAFFKQFSGKYADESEERVIAKLIREVDKLGVPVKEGEELYGLNITDCVKAILINIKHKPAFAKKVSDTSIPNLMDDEGNISYKKDNIPGLDEYVKIIKRYARNYRIPIIFWNSKTTNHDVLSELK